MLSNESMIGFTWGGTVFASLPLFLRFIPISGARPHHARRRRTTVDHFSASSLLVYAAFFCAVTFTASITYRQALEIQWRGSTDPDIIPGLGMPYKDAYNSMMVSLGEMQAFVLTLWCVKWSFLAMYYPMLPRLTNTLRYVWYGILIYTIITFGIVFPLEFIWCRPARRLWSFEDDYCSSWRSTSGLLVGCLLNVTADTMVIIFPILILRNLVRTTRERAGVFFLVFIGLFVICASFTRLGLLIKRNQHPENATAASLQAAEVWAAVESYAALWAANLPSARAFVVTRWFGRETSTAMDTIGSQGRSRSRTVNGLESESETKINGVDVREAEEGRESPFGVPMEEFDLAAMEQKRREASGFTAGLAK